MAIHHVHTTELYLESMGAYHSVNKAAQPPDLSSRVYRIRNVGKPKLADSVIRRQNLTYKRHILTSKDGDIGLMVGEQKAHVTQITS